MRLGLVVGALKTGGSERQLCELAAGMAERSHAVEVAAYDGPGTFDQWVTMHGVTVRHGGGGSRIAKVQWLRRWLATFDPDVVHGFMKRASSLAVLATLPERRPAVVGSDLSTATYSRRQPVLWASLVLFAFARLVVTQTEMNSRSLKRLAPWLHRKVVVVRNGCDTARFLPAAGPRPARPFRFLSVGTIYRVKNPVGVVEAFRRLRDRGFEGSLDWAGAPGSDGQYVEAQRRISAYGLEQVVRFVGRQPRMEEVYPRYDALVHVSVQEGVPNAVVEAMACGLPIIVSRVSDLPLIAREAKNGLVCDETDPGAVADAMQALVEMPAAERELLGIQSRAFAERWFGRERFLDEYEALYSRLAARGQ